MNRRHLPNLLSVLRALLVVPVVAGVLGRQWTLAWVALAAAGASDFLDGWLARRWECTSRLGGLLDALADKLLIVGAYLALAVEGWIPAWLAALVTLRDALLVAGATLWRHVTGVFEARPTWLSKWNTALQIGFGLAMLLVAMERLPGGAWVSLGAACVGLCTLASGLQYLSIWALALRSRS